MLQTNLLFLTHHLSPPHIVPTTFPFNDRGYVIHISCSVTQCDVHVSFRLKFNTASSVGHQRFKYFDGEWATRSALFAWYCYNWPSKWWGGGQSLIRMVPCPLEVEAATSIALPCAVVLSTDLAGCPSTTSVTNPLERASTSCKLKDLPHLESTYYHQFHLLTTRHYSRPA